MIKFNTTLFAAALLITSGAMAEATQPAAGNAPYFSQALATNSTIERSTVQAQAARQRPAAGNQPFVAQTAAVGVRQVRSVVAAEALVRRPAVGELPFAS
ncbi:MAG: hypothetical protein LT082_01500 [Comamonas sp.]|jgi:hypothetical protein|nr:hypothetical protein [Comamonas sp.]